MRPFVILAFLVVGACQRERSSVAVDAALLTLVPEDTAVVGALRVKALKPTAAWQKLLQNPEVNRRMEEFAKETSFDPRQHLWELLWSSNGKETLFYARGEFAPMGLEPKLEREGARRMNYKGSMLLGNGESAVWFLNSSTAVFGRTSTLHALIDSRSARPPGPPRSLRERIDRIPATAHLWTVANANVLAPAAPADDDGSPNLMRNLPRLLRNVQTVTFEANLTDGLAVEATAASADEKGARQIHDSLRGLIAIARFSLTGEQKDALLPLLDALQVQQNQTETTLKGRVTTAQYTQALAWLAESSRTAKPPAD